MSGDEPSAPSHDLAAPPPPSFSSKDEELEYWERAARELRRELEKAHQDHAEFAEQSRELEEELEKSADASRRALEAQSEELRAWKEKYHAEKLESNAGMTGLQAVVDSLGKERDELRLKNRDLEQENDDLQRRHREISTSLRDAEEKLSAAIERNAMLQLELESGAGLKEEIQRLRDELRDQSDELAVRRDREQHQRQQPGGGREAPARRRSSAGNGFPAPPPSSTAGGAPLAFPATSKSTAAVTPTTGFGALNTPAREPGPVGPVGSANVNPVRMISDVLGRVKAIESRLAAYRNSFASPGTPPGVPQSSKSGASDAPRAAFPGFGPDGGGGVDENQRSGRGADLHPPEEQ